MAPSPNFKFNSKQGVRVDRGSEKIGFLDRGLIKFNGSLYIICSLEIIKKHVPDQNIK